MTAILPRISCIMPTHNRRLFIPRAIQYFLQQDYPNKELVIIDDGDDLIADLIPDDERFRYVSLSQQFSTGMVRNLAVAHATGEVICTYDDDDYYGSHRLTLQATPILTGEADMSGLRMSHLLKTADTALWGCSDAVHDAYFGKGIRCGTLLYKRAYWEQGIMYENRRTGEDVRFVEALLARGARLATLVDPYSYICVRHRENVTDDLDCTGAGWWRERLEDYVPEAECAFYRSLAREFARMS